MDRRSDALRGLRILVAEDEMLVLMEIEDMLEELGCDVVARASTVATALSAAENKALDGALLDMNLRRESVLPVAEKLKALNVPYLFVTGYAGGRGEAPILAEALRLTKPFTKRALGDAMVRAFTLQVPVDEQERTPK